MDLTITRHEQLYRLIAAQTSATVTTQAAHALGAGLGLSKGRVGSLLSDLEKANKLVRIERGIYMTMESYVCTMREE